MSTCYRKVENHQVSMFVCVREFYRTSSTIQTITTVNIHLVSVLVCTLEVFMIIKYFSYSI